MVFKGTFHFDLDHELEEAVRQGRKTIDVRVSIEPFADVKKGDTISYHHTQVKVSHIRAYAGLGDLLAHEDFRKIIPAAKDRNDALRTLLEGILQKNPPHGVLAIEFEPPEAKKP
jgi:ASC-1-like (ASCH) protein